MNVSDLWVACDHGLLEEHRWDTIAKPGANAGWCPGGRPATLEDLGDLLKSIVIPPQEGESKEFQREIGFCVEHHCLSERWYDGSWGCWWECIVETSGEHRDDDFTPLFQALAAGILIPLPQMVAGESL